MFELMMSHKYRLTIDGVRTEYIKEIIDGLSEPYNNKEVTVGPILKLSSGFPDAILITAAAFTILDIIVRWLREWIQKKNQEVKVPGHEISIKIQKADKVIIINAFDLENIENIRKLLSTMESPEDEIQK
jgi:hypothetical protein